MTGQEEFSDMVSLTIILPPDGWEWYDVARVGWGICRLIFLPKDGLGDYYVPCHWLWVDYHPLRVYFEYDVIPNLPEHCLREHPEVQVTANEIVLGELRGEVQNDVGWKFYVELELPLTDYVDIDDLWSTIADFPPDILDDVNYSFMEHEQNCYRLNYFQTSGWKAWGVIVDDSSWPRKASVVIDRIRQTFCVFPPSIVVDGMQIFGKKVCGRNAIVVVATEKGEKSYSEVSEVLEFVIGLTKTEVGAGLLENSDTLLSPSLLSE